MTPTAQNVFDAARFAINDVDPGFPAGQVFTNAHFRGGLWPNQAVEELAREMYLSELPRFKRTVYYNLPAYTSLLDPATVGVTSFGELDQENGVAERSIRNTAAVTAAALLTNPPRVDLTATAHPFTTGQAGIVYGIVGLSQDVNDLWVLEKTGANTVRLNGCVASGVWSSGGVITDSADEFIPMDELTDIETFPASAGSTLGYFYFVGGVFRFPAASVSRQIRIRLWESGSFPSTDGATIGIPNCLQFLAYRIAERACEAKGFAGAAEALRATAEKALDTIKRAGVKALQRNIQDFVTPPFRDARNVGPNYVGRVG